LRLWVFAFALLIHATVQAATFVVTSTADTAGSTCASSCTLRQAITAANATTAADTINFGITLPVRGELLIQPASALPTITQPLTINGYSQSGTRVNDDPVLTNAQLRIRIDGANAGPASSGLAICASNVVIRGLMITRFNQAGIRVGSDAAGANCSATATQIHGNFVGANNFGAALENDGMFFIAGNSNVGSASSTARLQSLSSTRVVASESRLCRMSSIASFKLTATITPVAMASACHWCARSCRRMVATCRSPVRSGLAAPSR
jgi:CSLREA domain-containing protein